MTGRYDFSAANQRRSAEAAARMSTQIAEALEILGASCPANLHKIALLRIEHPGLSLADLAELCDPPSTKDAVAGALRRVISKAARRAHGRA